MYYCSEAMQSNKSCYDQCILKVCVCKMISHYLTSFNTHKVDIFKRLFSSSEIDRIGTLTRFVGGRVKTRLPSLPKILPKISPENSSQNLSRKFFPKSFRKFFPKSFRKFFQNLPQKFSTKNPLKIFP